MARIAFLQWERVEWLGVMSLAAAAKSHGHRCEVFVESAERGDFLRSVLAGSPDVLAFSCLTSGFPWAIKTAAALRRHTRALTVVGGSHVTLDPEQAIAAEPIDVICRGEGDEAICDLADALDAGSPLLTIPNLWVRQGGEIHRNDVRPLIADLDRLPLADRELYQKYRFSRALGMRPLHLGRGCPWECTFCHNVHHAALYKGKGPRVRWRKVDAVLAEIEQLRSTTSMRLLHIVDDAFGVNQRWLLDFLPRLAAQSGRRLAVQASLRAESVTDELCACLRDYGRRLVRLRIAVECGDEVYRRTVLGKDLSNGTLLRAAELFHKHAIPFGTYNMMPLPGERFEQALSTLRLNLAMRPRPAFCFIYQPFPGTDLAEHAVRLGVLPRESLAGSGTGRQEGGYHSASQLRQPDVRKVENLQRVFTLLVALPAARWLLLRLVERDGSTHLLRLIDRAWRWVFSLHRRVVDGF